MWIMQRTESLCPRFFWTILRLSGSYTLGNENIVSEWHFSLQSQNTKTKGREWEGHNKTKQQKLILWPAISSVNFRQYVKTSRLRKGLGPCCAEFPHGTVVRGRICNQVPAQLCSNRPNKRWRDQISQLGTKSTQFHDCSQGPSTRPSVGTSNRKPWKRGCLCAIWQWPVGNKRLFKDSYFLCDYRLRQSTSKGWFLEIREMKKCKQPTFVKY